MKNEKCPSCGRLVQICITAGGRLWVGLWCGHWGPVNRETAEGPTWGEFKREDYPVMKPNSLEAKK